MKKIELVDLKNQYQKIEDKEINCLSVIDFLLKEDKKDI